MGSIGAFIDLFRKGVRLREPEGIKNSTVWLGIFTAIVTIASNYGFSASWLNPETLQRAAEFMPSLFALFAVPATLITTRKIGLPFLDPKPMIQPASDSTIPQYIEPEVYPDLPEVRGSFVGSNSSGMQAAAAKNQERVNPTAIAHGLSYAEALPYLATPRTYIARTAWIAKRNYVLRMRSDANYNAGWLTMRGLGEDWQTAITAPWMPSAEDGGAQDWFVIDGWSEGSDRYLNPAQADVGCQVKVSNHGGELVLEKDYCITEDGVLAPVSSGVAPKKPKPVAAPVVKSANKYSQRAQQLAKLLDNDNIRAFLETIRYAEGTSKPEHYFVQFGYNVFKDISDKPRRVIRKGKYRSSAAGAYQIINKTWDHIQSKLSLPDFSPLSQDIAALLLIEEENQIDNILSGDIEAAIQGVGNVWASFPNNKYGQPQRKKEKLLAKFEQNRAIA